MTTTAERLDQLSSHIQAAAVAVAFQYQANIDDLAQTARLAILEHAQRHPDFLSQTDSYIVQFGVWRARDAIRRELREHKFAGADLPENDAGDLILPTVSNPWPDVHLRMTLSDLFAGLDRDLLLVADRLAAGLGIKEIAEDLDIDRVTVYRRRLRIAKALSAC